MTLSAGLMALRSDGRAMAALRRILRDGEYLSAHAARYVDPLVPPDAGYNMQPCVYLAAGLFGLNPQHETGRSLGHVYGAIIAATPRGQRTGGGSTGACMYEDRFTRILATAREELAQPLRHAVTLAAQHNLGLDFDLLLADLLHWDDPGGVVRLRIAAECWRDVAEARSATIERLAGGRPTKVATTDDGRLVERARALYGSKAALAGTLGVTAGVLSRPRLSPEVRGKIEALLVGDAGTSEG